MLVDLLLKYLNISDAQKHRIRGSFFISFFISRLTKNYINQEPAPNALGAALIGSCTERELLRGRETKGGSEWATSDWEQLRVGAVAPSESQAFTEPAGTAPVRSCLHSD